MTSFMPILAATLTATRALASTNPEPVHADYVLYNARIFTAQHAHPGATAPAIKDRQFTRSFPPEGRIGGA